jgi:hypothetical protein
MLHTGCVTWNAGVVQLLMAVQTAAAGDAGDQSRAAAALGRAIASNILPQA